MLRLSFFICLLLALGLSVLSLFVGGHPGLETDEIAVLGAILALLMAVIIMAWRGKVFKRDGRWEYKSNDDRK